MAEKETPPAPVVAELPDAAKRALAEAEERRRAAKEAELPKELGGREALFLPVAKSRRFGSVSSTEFQR